MKLMNALKNKCKKNKIDNKPLVKLQAKVIISTLSYNNSVMVIDENGRFHTLPIPDPVEEELIVKPGDQVKGFEIIEILENFIELKSFMEYTEGNSSNPKTHFIVEKGDSINLSVYGLCDAVERISINYIETIEL